MMECKDRKNSILCGHPLAPIPCPALFLKERLPLSSLACCVALGIIATEFIDCVKPENPRKQLEDLMSISVLNFLLYYVTQFYHGSKINT